MGATIARKLATKASVPSTLELKDILEKLPNELIPGLMRELMTWTKRCGPEAIKNVKCKIGPGLFLAKEVGSVIKIDCLSRESMEDLVNVILVDAKLGYCDNVLTCYSNTKVG